MFVRVKSEFWYLDPLKERNDAAGGAVDKVIKAMTTMTSTLETKVRVGATRRLMRKCTSMESSD
jgi:hypothetical protein